MQEIMVRVDGKEIKKSEMPPNCYMIKGEWYTEEGLPEKLEAYRRLWTESRPPEGLEPSKQPCAGDEKEKQKKTIIPTEPPPNQEVIVDTVDETNIDEDTDTTAEKPVRPNLNSLKKNDKRA